MNWYKISQLNNSIKDIMNKWQSQGITLYLYESKGVIVLDSIIVPKNLRKQGIGSEIMQDIIDYADSIGKRVELTTGQKDDYHGTTSRQRLINFYKRFNFVQNKGRHKDFSTSHSMYREPHQLLNAQTNLNKKAQGLIDGSLILSSVEEINEDLLYRLEEQAVDVSKTDSNSIRQENTSSRPSLTLANKIRKII